MTDPPSISRRTVLGRLAALGGTGLVLGGVTASATARQDAGLPGAVGLRTVARGLGTPVAVAFAPAANRRYVADLAGRVLVHEPDGVLEEPFLDLRDAIEPSDEPRDEQGLLGIALHPEFARNRRFFVRYSAPPRPGTPEDFSHTFVLSEFEATLDGRRAVPGSERALLEIPEPRPWHNAGDLAFGPDGYLYVPVGDSGFNRYGQDVTENFLGSLLRIDVDGEATASPRQGGGGTADGSEEVRGEQRPYAIPDDNPLVGRDGRDEYYAWGFRNPWRLAFDGSDLFVGDVGQSRFEEVDLVRKGGNYGWDVREGTHCFEAEGCPETTPDDVRDGEPLLEPIIEYPHSGAAVSGAAVVGGQVYRGDAIPGLGGAYVFGDFVAQGRLFVGTRPEGGGDGGEDGLWPTSVLEIGDGGAKLQRLLSFGRDGDGEVYALGTGSVGGGLFRIGPANE